MDHRPQIEPEEMGMPEGHGSVSTDSASTAASSMATRHWADHYFRVPQLMAGIRESGPTILALIEDHFHVRTIYLPTH
jgi:hypothetical protein